MVRLDDIDRKILRFLSKQDWPATTENIADAADVSWNTAQIHLYKLASEGFVKGRRVGRQNQWIATRKGKRSDGGT